LIWGVVGEREPPNIIFFAFFCIPSRDYFPPLKIQNIPKTWPKIVDFGLFQHPHSKPLRIRPIISHNIFIYSLKTLCKCLINNCMFSTKIDPNLQKPIIFIFGKTKA
jgi:hypothetical protein